jgi:peptide/histidine transporter 3/4
MMESGGGELLPGPALPITSKPGGDRGGWRAALFIVGNHADYCKSFKFPSSSAGFYASLSLLLLLLPFSDGIL